MSIGATYTLWFYTPTLTSIGFVVDMTRLRIVRSITDIGSLSVSIPISVFSFDWRTITRDYLIGVQRKPDGSVFRLETDTLWFVTGVLYNETQQEVEILAVPLVHLLKRRVVVGMPGSAAADKNGAADTIIQAYINEAIGPGATTGRAIAGLSITPASGGGALVFYTGSMRNLYDVVQDIQSNSADQGVPIYVDITYDGSTMQCATYLYQRGNDHGTNGTTVYFGNTFDNLTDITVNDDWSSEITSAYVLGAGDTTALISNARATATPFSRTEFTVNAGQTKDVFVLQTYGSSTLYNNRQRRFISGTIINTNFAVYGIDWGFGDIVAVLVDDQAYDVMIESIEITLDANNETISAKFRSEVSA